MKHLFALLGGIWPVYGYTSLNILYRGHRRGGAVQEAESSRLEERSSWSKRFTMNAYFEHSRIMNIWEQLVRTRHHTSRNLILQKMKIDVYCRDSALELSWELWSGLKTAHQVRLDQMKLTSKRFYNSYQRSDAAMKQNWDSSITLPANDGGLVRNTCSLLCYTNVALFVKNISKRIVNNFIYQGLPAFPPRNIWSRIQLSTD